MHHELWITAFLNQFLAGPANAILSAFGQHADNPARPWNNFQAMQLLVFVLMLIVFGLVRAGFSVQAPSKIQHLLESLYTFLRGQTDEVGIHHGGGLVPFFGTLFLFVLFCNLIGIVPGFESPTMFPPVPLGCALATFIFYNWLGLKKQGPIHYGAHFLGPIPVMAPIMLPIEIVSHLARPLSLTVRLYANMFAGEQVTIAFLGLTYVLVPAVFMGLHVFVSFLQAYIFTLMTMIYVSSAMEGEH
ncbi:MAG: F0F1 ATP synthase subunit A [Acidobacteria bacterium]|nr:F0F1 ATP synthase subunit A [Acidobacteriota bacterium]